MRYKRILVPILATLGLQNLALGQSAPYSCQSFFIIARNDFKNSFQLPVVEMKFGDDKPEAFDKYYWEKSRLENNQYSAFSRTKEEQIALVAKLRILAINEVIELLKTDSDIIDMSDFIRSVVERNLDWVYGVPKLDIMRYELILLKEGIDPNSRPISLAAIFRQFNYPSLLHDTTISNLIGILKRGKIVSRQKGLSVDIKGGDAEYAYLEAIPKYYESHLIDPVLKKEVVSKGNERALRSGYFEPGRLYLEIDSSVLDISNLSHWSMDWNYGKKYAGSYVNPTYTIAAFLNAMYSRSYQPRNELLLTQAVPIDGYLKGIHVHPNDIEITKKVLREAGVKEEFILLVK